MITKEITICGKVVTLAYCYATEIAYKDLSDCDMADYIQEAMDSIKDERDPDIKRTIYAILACMIAYYQSRGEEMPILDTDLMNNAKPAEIGIAIFTIIDLRMQFYRVPNGEPADKTPAESDGGSKNS